MLLLYIQYGANCTRNCGLSWERKEYLNWINDTCFVIGPGTGLPSNWTALLPVQRSEMLPWSWQLSSQIQSSSGAPSRPHCPSTSSKLWAFAAVNLAIALFIPVIGRRTVVKKLSNGYLGRQESQRWYFTGPLAVGLHIASNAVNAVIIKNTLGFQNISVKDLTFLWCTRPRIAWLIVALVPWQAEKAMYFSSAASTLFGEVVLQLFGSYYMGMAANYARRQKFFIKDHLAGTWYAKQAMIMYSGSILWLTAVAFAIFTCLATVFGVNESISSLGRYWTETRRIVKNNCALISAQLGTLQSARSKLRPPGDVPWRQTVAHLHSDVNRSIETLVEEWNHLTVTWRGMPDELRREANNRKSVTSRAQKAKERRERTRPDSKNWDQRFKDDNDAGQAAIDIDEIWFTTTPDSNQSKAHGQQNRIEIDIAADKWAKARVERQVRECESSIQPFTDAIKNAQALVDADDKEFDTIATNQKLLSSKKRRFSKVSSAEILRELKTRREALVNQRLAHQKDLEAAKANPQRYQEQSRRDEFQAVGDLWTAVIESRTALKANWAENQTQWRQVGERRKEDSERKPDVGHFPPIVVAGMLLCWIAQWLWWAGYIGVAGDGYCPPKLPLIASIWTIFSTTGMIFGTSF